MNLIYLGIITLVVSTAMEVSADDGVISDGEASEGGVIPEDNDDDMPEELKKLFIKDSTLGESLIKIIKMVKDFSSDIWIQPVNQYTWRERKPNTHLSISIKRLLTKARNVTKMARNSSETLQKSLRWIDVALDDVDKVMNAIMSIQGKASKIQDLLQTINDIEEFLPYGFQEGYVFATRIIYEDIQERLYNYHAEFSTGARKYVSFRQFNTILGQLMSYTSKWLNLYYPIEPSTKRVFRAHKRRIRHLQEIARRFHGKFGPDVNALAKRLKQKINDLEKVSRKKLRKARGDA
ncbi:unnamed protein product [Owenia fusiformis]|uniref:Uncharacterized protein n=1 Tax=Owenia fusiformis TaxID=6347 RepID=A0A8S4NTZ5_OWEFU|nr:unnamed protein product [Owenia fusiformis]